MNPTDKFIRYCGAFTGALVVLLGVGVLLALLMWAFVTVVEQIF